MADHGHEITMPARLGPQNAEAVLVIVVGDPLDEAGQHFLGRWFRLRLHADRRIREHHLRTDLFPEPNSERWLSWIVVGKPPPWRSAVVGMG